MNENNGGFADTASLKVVLIKTEQQGVLQFCKGVSTFYYTDFTSLHTYADQSVFLSGISYNSIHVLMDTGVTTLCDPVMSYPVTEIIPPASDTFLKDLSTETQNLISPNPFSYSATDQIDPDLKADIMIVFNSMGSIVKQQKILTDEKSVLLNREKLKSGIYLLDIQGKNGHKTQKFIID